MVGSTVKSAVLVVSPKTVILEDIQHRCKLGKQENSVTIGFATEIEVRIKHELVPLPLKQLV